MAAPGEHVPGPADPDVPETAEQRRARYDADEVHSLRERVAEAGWRRWIAARRSMDTPYRGAVGLLGGIVVTFGIVTIPLPGPGWLTVLAGLFLLATEFTWAERVLEFTRLHVSRWSAWLNRQQLFVRLSIAAVTAAFVVGVLVVMLHLTGVPDWVPGWVPLWR